MKTCKICSKKNICKEPCDWLKDELKKVEVGKEYLTFTDLGLIDETLQDKGYDYFGGQDKDFIDANMGWD